VNLQNPPPSRACEFEPHFVHYYRRKRLL